MALKDVLKIVLLLVIISYSYFKLLVKSFVEMTRFLLTQPNDGELYVLSQRISQDLLENYFGMQRACGGRNKNSNLQQCTTNASALRIQILFEVIAAGKGTCLMISSLQ